MNFDAKYPLHVSCFKGLSEYLAGEIVAAGLEVAAARETSVETRGSLLEAMRLNLRLRTALNVNLLLGEFECATPDELYLAVRGLPWEEIIPVGGRFTVDGRIDTAAVDNTMFAALRAKDAIADRMTEKLGARADSGPEKDGAVVALFWRDGRAWVYLNTSGRKLSDRSYRQAQVSAPLRESLAAGIMLATGYDGSVPLVCPMCGSGTLAIEAALLAAGRAPGLLRGNFGFMHLVGFPEEKWKALRREEQRSPRREPAPIVVSDIDPAAVEAARANAKTAGVDRFMEFRVCDFAETPVPPGGGVIVMNPEYGRRLGEVRELEKLYPRIGDWLKKSCPGYSGFVFTGNLELAKKVGLKPKRRLMFWNAKIECRLLEYELYAGSRERPAADGR